ncbi:MAG: hypothetical protein ACK56F_05535, partial [bacterium]
IEPARPDRDIALRRDPRLAILVAFGERLLRRRIVVADAVSCGLQHGPAGVAGPALLVADPPDVGTDIAEDHRIGL